MTITGLTVVPNSAPTMELDAGGELVSVERPIRAGGDLVVVRTSLVPMCTEFKERAVRSASERLGHEGMGVVVDAGASTRVRSGDRVVVMPNFGCGCCEMCLRGEHIFCRFQRDMRKQLGVDVGYGAFADYVVRPDHILLTVPDDISDEHAALTCCTLGPAFSAVERMAVAPGQTVIVSGCGPVGLGAIVQAVDRGARVIAVSPNTYRSELALAVGAEVVLDPRREDIPASVRELTSGAGADAIIETSGVIAAVQAGVAALRTLGQVAIVAWGASVALEPPVPTGLTLHACWHWNHRVYSERMWSSVRRSGAALDKIVTHRFPLAHASAAMDVQDTGRCGKVLLTA